MFKTGFVLWKGERFGLARRGEIPWEEGFDAGSEGKPPERSFQQGNLGREALMRQKGGGCNRRIEKGNFGEKTLFDGKLALAKGENRFRRKKRKLKTSCLRERREERPPRGKEGKAKGPDGEPSSGGHLYRLGGKFGRGRKQGTKPSPLWGERAFCEERRRHFAKEDPDPVGGKGGGGGGKRFRNSNKGRKWGGHE